MAGKAQSINRHALRQSFRNVLHEVQEEDHRTEEQTEDSVFNNFCKYYISL